MLLVPKQHGLQVVIKLQANRCFISGDLIDVKVSNKNLKKTIQKRFDFNVSDVEITFIGKCSKHN